MGLGRMTHRIDPNCRGPYDYLLAAQWARGSYFLCFIPGPNRNLAQRRRSKTPLGFSCRCAEGREVREMADVLVKQLVEAGVHFGHRASRWNPKMGPYIYGRQKLIHIIDVRETVRGLLRARKYFKQGTS